MTDWQRSLAIAHILSDCPDIWSDDEIIQTALRLQYTFSGENGVDYPYLDAAVKEYRAQLTKEFA